MTDEELLEVALAEFRKAPKATWEQQRAAMAAVVQAVRQAQWDEFDRYALTCYPDEMYDLVEETFQP